MIRIPPDAARKLRKVRAEAQQMVRDIQWWNANRTDAEPFDCGSELVLVSICNRGLQAVESGDGDDYARICEELINAAFAGASRT